MNLSGYIGLIKKISHISCNYYNYGFFTGFYAIINEDKMGMFICTNYIRSITLRGSMHTGKS
jgi:hypothetical protein